MNKTWLAIVLAISLLSCGKENFDPKLPPITGVPVTAIPPVPITVNIDQSHRGFNIASDFEGLSYETGLLVENPDFLNENNAVLIQLIKNLGKGILRIGGNTSDEIDWSGSNNQNPASLALKPSDIDRLSGFSRAIGWPVLFGLNLGKYDTLAAANEALYISNNLKTNLYALQSGNEPDAFKWRGHRKSYNYEDYRTEWETYFTAVKKAAPDVHFAGPDVDPFNAKWIGSFSADEHSKVRLLDGHYYSTGPASDSSITYHDLLKPNTKLNGYLLQFSKIAAHYHAPYRISECNSIFNGGKPGVSDSFASALWALDLMWTVAENHGQGINFHGGGPRFAYTPIVGANGIYTARPEYYAMLAFKYGSAESAIIPATILNPRDYNNCTVYAAANKNGSYSVTLINKETAKNFSFTIQLTKTASAIKILRLTAPTIESTSGTTFGGSSVAPDGTFAEQTTGQSTINGKSFVVTVPAGSAAVVTVLQ